MAMRNRAMVIRSEGEPLELEERAIPTPRRGQILVRNRATSLNFHDVVNIAGGIPRLPLPRVPFSDGCAEIVALGEDVLGFEIGDRVIPNFFPFWADGDLGGRSGAVVLGDHVDGMLQNHVALEAGSVVKVPVHLSNREAATLGCAGVTAWRSLIVEARIKPGAVVLLQGTGGVSLFALAFAKMAGATVILTSSSDEKLDRADKLGADHVHNYRRDPAWDRFVMSVTNGRGADVIVDIGGLATLPLAFRAAAMNGHVSMIGIRSGVDAEPELPVRRVFSKNLTVKGITVGSRRHLADMCAAVEASGMRPTIDSVFGMDEVDDAIAVMNKQSHFGKIVIDIS